MTWSKKTAAKFTSSALFAACALFLALSQEAQVLGHQIAEPKTE